MKPIFLFGGAAALLGILVLSGSSKAGEIKRTGIGGTRKPEEPDAAPEEAKPAMPLYKAPEIKKTEPEDTSVKAAEAAKKQDAANQYAKESSHAAGCSAGTIDAKASIKAMKLDHSNAEPTNLDSYETGPEKEAASGGYKEGYVECFDKTFAESAYYVDGDGSVRKKGSSPGAAVDTSIADARNDAYSEGKTWGRTDAIASMGLGTIVTDHANPSYELLHRHPPSTEGVITDTYHAAYNEAFHNNYTSPSKADSMTTVGTESSEGSSYDTLGGGA